MIIWKCKDCNWINIQLGDPTEAKPKLKSCTACEVYEMEQDLCEHKNYEKGICVSCNLKCEHQEIDEGYCLDCGEFVCWDYEPDEDWIQSQKDRI